MQISELAREKLSQVLRDHPAPESIDADEDLVEVYGLTSLNKILFLTSLCKAADIGLEHFTENDLATMRTLGQVVDALNVHAPQRS